MGQLTIIICPYCTTWLHSFGGAGKQCASGKEREFIMYVDAMTLTAVLDEWHRLLIGARIDTIVQPTEHAIALQCYVPAREERGTQREQGERTERVERNRWLYLSAHPQMARVHITARKPTKIASEPPPFVMLLRKYSEGT